MADKLTLERLKADLEASDKKLDELDAAYRRKLKSLYRNFDRQLTGVLNNPRILGPEGRLKLERAIQLQAELKPMLKAAGLDDLLKDYTREFPRLTEDVLRYFRLVGAKPETVVFDEEMRKQIKLVVNRFNSQISTHFDRSVISPVDQALSNSVLGGLEGEQFVQAITEVTASFSSNTIETFTVDSFAQFSRAVRVAGGQRVGLEIYQYLGPLDRITSEQCQHLLAINRHGVPGMLYKHEITTDLHPALRADPLINGGHYNCRHQYYPVTEDFAKQQGFKA